METKRIVSPGAEELLDKYFPILDHGFAALKDYMGTDESVEEAARTSYSYGTRQKGDTEALIRSMMRRGHTSPFEQLELKFHVGMPIFVARQWVRHRTASLNEMSGRYSLMPMLFYTPELDQVKAQCKWDKQGRDGDLDSDRIDDWRLSLHQRRVQTRKLYHWACREDFARELARIDLPLSTYTVWYWKMDVHNLFHFLSLRCDEHAQWEIRQYANIIAQMLKMVAPLSFKAWEDYHFNAVKLSRQELELLQKIVQTYNTEDYKVLTTCEGHVDPRNYGLTKTETRELFGKIDKQFHEFEDLDLSESRDPEYFAKMYKDSAEGDE